MQQILKDMRRETDNFRDVKNILFSANGNRKFASVGFSIQVDNWASLFRIFSKSWFTRLWIVQEAALPRRSICYLGSFEFPLEDVLRTALWLVHKNDKLAQAQGHEPPELCGTANFWV